MSDRHRAVWIRAAAVILTAALPLLTLFGCGVVGPSMSEQYRLARWGDATVPVQITQLPVAPGSQELLNCWYTLADGELTFDLATAHFNYAIRYRNSCSGRVMWTSQRAGYFVQNGAEVSLVTPRPDGTARTTSARISGSRIILQLEEIAVFTRAK